MGIKPQWTNLACKTTPAAQPGVSGLPGLVTTYSYDYLFRPTSMTETVAAADGSTKTRTRTSTSTFEAGGYGERSTQVAVATTGSYDSNGRVGSVADTKGTRAYTYNGGTEHRGLPTAMSDSNLTGTFSGSYDANGSLASQNYPNGLTTTTVDETASATGLTTTAPDGSTTWLTETVSSSIDGQWRTRNATTSSQVDSYDRPGGSATSRTPPPATAPPAPTPST